MLFLLISKYTDKTFSVWLAKVFEFIKTFSEYIICVIQNVLMFH